MAERRSRLFFGERGAPEGFVPRAFTKKMGYTDEDLRRPLIGIAQTWSEFNPCNIHFREIAEAVKRGVWQAGGLPLEFPTISLGEVHTRPTTMFLRNLMAMDTEEMIRAQPMDGVVLLAGCDKITPAQLMAAASADIPSIMVTGATLGSALEQSEITTDREVIAPLDRPLAPEGGTAILWGNLAPDGAVIKQSAASPHLLRHRGRAVVFRSIADLRARIDAPDLAVTPDDVLVLQHAGPIGGPGMPEVGNMPLPAKLLRQGVRDMVRISDARMSGTAFGTVVLHVAPEAAVGGPLALVRYGDQIALDVHARRLTLEIHDAELARRRAEWAAPPPAYSRGYGRLFLDHVLQAPQGCDFDFLHP